MKMSTHDRFMRWVSPEPNTGCWLWTGTDDGYGYGQFRINHRTYRAHRVAYELLVGRIPAGLHLDHLCRVPCCVNPAHLEPVTSGENSRRGNAGKYLKARTHCQKGHPYSPENTTVYRGSRHCCACERIYIRAWKQAQKEKRNVSAPSHPR